MNGYPFAFEFSESLCKRSYSSVMTSTRHASNEFGSRNDLILINYYRFWVNSARTASKRFSEGVRVSRYFEAIILSLSLSLSLLKRRIVNTTYRLFIVSSIWNFLSSSRFCRFYDRWKFSTQRRTNRIKSSGFALRDLPLGVCYLARSGFADRFRGGDR